MQDGWVQAIAEYTTALRAGRRSAGTIRLHRHYLHNLAATSRGGPWSLAPGDLRRFVAGYTTRSAETMKSARSTVVSFYRWAHTEGRVAVDPSVGLPAVSVPPGVPRPAPEAVLRRALAVAGHRERVMLLLAAYGGLRCCEIAAVHADDLDPAGVLYVTGKGGKTRIVPILHEEILGALARADGYLFPGQVNGHLAAGTVSKLLAETLEGDWTAHKLRHRFSTRSYARNRDLLALQRVLGHSRPETTMRYVQLSHEALVAVVRGAA